MSIRWRLTLFHALTMLLVVALLTGVLIAVIFVVMHLLTERPTRERANEAAAIVETSGTLSASELSRLSEDGIFLILRDEQGRIIAQTDDVPETLTARDEVIWQMAMESGFSKDGEADGHYIYVVPVARPDEPLLLVESLKAYTILDQGGVRITVPPAGLAGIAAGAALISILPAILGSFLVARRALAPVNAIVGSVRNISEDDLSQRLPVRSRRDELGRLATTFNDLLARLETAFAEREETLASQRRFVADAGHELRTPLSSILGYARLLREWGINDPEVARESLAAIEREAARMSELVEELLDLARGDEGMPLVLEVVDLRELVDAAVEAARMAAAGSVEITYEEPPEAVVATVDADRIRQAAGILLDNAVKYTPEGGTVIVTLREAGEKVELEVADTGIGIAAEHLPHLFDRFYRVDTARSQSGSGLGLSIAREIADQHGGTITVASRLVHGSTFTLRLPQPGPVVPEQ
jgi:signal transduction histidine kinase